jgi:putative MATE family efflux protein
MISRFIDTRLLQKVWTISWPTVIYSLMETGVGLVDIYLAGYVGDNAVASIGLCRQIYLILLISTMAITTGTITLVAQYYGAKQYDQASSIAYHSIFLAIVAGIVIGTAGVFMAKPALILIGATGDVLRYGVDYLRFLLGGVVFLLVNFSSNGVFRALGDAKTPFKIALVINLLNVFFSYLFLFGYGWIPAFGIMGIAMGTILSRGIGAAVALYLLAQRSRIVRLKMETRLRQTFFMQIMRIGLPAGFSGFFRNGARILFFWILATSAESHTALAAATICFQIRMITIMPSLAFQVGVSALVGHSIGRNKIEEAEAYGWTSTKLCSFIMGIVSLVLFMFPELFITLFTKSEAVLELGKICMRFIVLEQFCNCVSIVVSGALSGAGDTKPALYYTILSQWFVMFPLALFLEHYTAYGVTGAWLAWGIAPILQAVLTLNRFHQGKWKTMNVRENRWLDEQV